ncbi:DUF885 domain-containing protein [Parerythrobacter jejuensis]|uniref:DUF885 family protein n=1 Tax=Parerythrobacter jejuensis TaxID=795812 RepID=A0A845AQ11_9SPHN|nr:DUF885 domain-containing protein [Parerythrobacter jejuensis]MXP30985.1 DUF885 family protein [Parerythrobacter jejuensis]MXP33745.1 DUF885 family protein [Parerythrobacter jejuensis]
MKTLPILFTSVATLAVAGCSGAYGETATATSTQRSATDTAVAAPATDISQLFEDYDAAQLELSPMSKSYRGIRDADYGRWGDFSDAAEKREFDLLMSTASAMEGGYDLASLNAQDGLSYRLFNAMAERRASLFPFRNYGYIFNQMNGAQSQLPAFLINIHRVSNESQAADYVSRIEGMGEVVDTLVAEARERADAGVMPPDWVYPYVISDVENLVKDGQSNAILDDFAAKVAALDIADEAKMELVNASLAAWSRSAKPAYQRLLAEMKRQQSIAPTDDGVWRFPQGADYYKALLANYTTTDLSADEIHNIGLREVERIHGEMRAIMAKVGFEGSLQDFFQFTRNDDRFFYTSREEYIADAQAKIDALGEKMPEFFGVLPTDPLTIKPVEAFREKSAGKAFYQRPAPDGSRPGTYYVNLYNLRDMSKNELEALAYHEGLPGHHLQLSIQTQLGNVPAFRRFGGVTAYSEGWGLYSEELGKDMGFYTDPYSDFGRLGMELWRACRLVVDTGLHHKRWSREQAIQYLTDNTPNPDGDIRKAIERYIVYPGQATAYMIGKLKIMELRSRARTELGDRFDIRGFHDTILTSGPVPLSIMEENVISWIEQQKGAQPVMGQK